MKTVFDLVNAPDGEPLGQLYRSRSVDGFRDLPEWSSIPIRSDDSAVRAMLLIELIGAESEIKAGEVWDVTYNLAYTNPTSARVFFRSELRVNNAAGNNRDGDQILPDMIEHGITDTFRNGRITRSCLHRWPSDLPAVTNRFIKVICWATATTNAGDLTIHDNRGHMSLMRYRGPVPLGA